MRAFALQKRACGCMDLFVDHARWSKETAKVFVHLFDRQGLAQKDRTSYLDLFSSVTDQAQGRGGRSRIHEFDDTTPAAVAGSRHVTSCPGRCRRAPARPVHERHRDALEGTRRPRVAGRRVGTLAWSRSGSRCVGHFNDPDSGAPRAAVRGRRRRCRPDRSRRGRTLPGPAPEPGCRRRPYCHSRTGNRNRTPR